MAAESLSQAPSLVIRRSGVHLLAAGALVGLLVYLHTQVAQVAFVSEGSMVPTVGPGDRVLVSLSAYNHRPPQRGDLVVTDASVAGERVLKRVIGVEGDVVAIGCGVVYLNGSPLNEPYVHQAMLLEDAFRVEVGPGQVSVCGVAVYLAVAAALVVLVSAWLMLVWPVGCALPPVIDPAGDITGAVHV